MDVLSLKYNIKKYFINYKINKINNKLNIENLISEVFLRRFSSMNKLTKILHIT